MSLDSALQDFEAKSIKAKYSTQSMKILIGAGSCEYEPGSFKSTSPLSKLQYVFAVSYDPGYNVTSLIAEPVSGQRTDLTSLASQPVILETVLSLDPRPLYRRLKNSITQVSNTLYVYERKSNTVTAPFVNFRAEFHLSANGALEKLVTGTVINAGANKSGSTTAWINISEVVF